MPPTSPAGQARLHSIDAIRGLMLFTMIFVNDLAGVPDTIVPAWMKHYHGKSGMTFVDLVFPGFLFLVGMSIPLAIGTRTERGEPLAGTLGHVLRRTLGLLLVGILMVNETPDTVRMGWSGDLWVTLMYFSAMLTFCHFRRRPSATTEPHTKPSPESPKPGRIMRWTGLCVLILLAVVFRGADGHRIVSLEPLSLHTEWYGILGLIGWAYLVGCAVFLAVRHNPTTLLAATVLLMALYPAEASGAFQQFAPARFVSLGSTLGSQSAITVAGILLTVLILQSGTTPRKIRSVCWFIAGFAAAAWLLHGLYGINKNAATPSWCLWSCAITAALWLIVDTAGNALKPGCQLQPLVVAGQNVFLGYLLSEALPSTLEVLHLGSAYANLAQPTLTHAVARSAGCAFLVLLVSTSLNRLGVFLKL